MNPFTQLPGEANEAYLLRLVGVGRAAVSAASVPLLGVSLVLARCQVDLGLRDAELAALRARLGEGG